MRILLIPHGSVLVTFFYITSSNCHLINKCRLTFIQTMIIDENGKYIHDTLNVINVTL